MTRLRSSTFARPPSPYGLRRTGPATADKSSFGEARSARSRGGHEILRACPAVAAQLRRRAGATAAAVVIGGGTSVLACPLCFGAAETPLINGANLGVLMLLGVTLAVQGGFVAFFIYLRTRAKRMADAELASEWSELQGATRAS